MTQRSVTYLRGRFETGDIPTQSDYYDIFDSFLNLESSATQTVGGKIVATAMDVTTVSAHVVHVQGRLHNSYLSVSALGTAHSSAAGVSADITLVHVNDGDRAIVLVDHHGGSVQYIINASTSTTAASIYPSSGCNFIGTAANAHMLLAVDQTIQIIHINASAYAWVRY